MSFNTEQYNLDLCLQNSLDLSSANSKQDLLKKTLLSSNQLLITQIDKNKKYIKSLQSFLAWISSSSIKIAPELTSLMLSNNQQESSYDYEILLLSDFTKCICKSKYFSFKIELASLNGLPPSFKERVPIEIKVYTTDEIPRQITTTMQGNHIIRGKKIEYLCFNEGDQKFYANIKMQINEVSSHFVNGTINLVVSKGELCHYSIKPLLIKDIVVKAKEVTCERWRQDNR